MIDLTTPEGREAFIERTAPIDLGNPGALTILLQLDDAELGVIERSSLRGAEIYNEFVRQGGWDGFRVWLTIEALAQSLRYRA